MIITLEVIMNRGDQLMGMLTIREVVKRSGRSRATVNRAIRSGLLSAHRDSPGSVWMIEESELSRVWPERAHDQDHDQINEQSRSGPDQDAIRQRDQLIAAHEQTIADLRQRLDQERAERQQAVERLIATQERVAALLTDQRAPAPPAATPRRSWWLWGRL
jgi:hypothetical protein